VQKPRRTLSTTITLAYSNSAAIFHTSPVANCPHSAFCTLLQTELNHTAKPRPWLKPATAHYKSNFCILQGCFHYKDTNN